jgi:N6-adenosine-specific RNA methylase IME4
MSVASEERRARTALKQARRAQRERELAVQIRALPNKVYGVGYIDVPWNFEVYSRETGMDRHAENHYPTMTTAAIKALPVRSIMAKDSVIFMWATPPFLAQALEVMAAWDFEYKTSATWNKLKTGHGYWFRGQHELLLIGTRGRVPCPAAGTQWDSVIDERRTSHSTKPEKAYELIEDYFPNLPRIELFARKARPGWDCWGNEAPNAEAAE